MRAALCLLLALLASCAATVEAHEARVLSYNIHHGQGEDGRFDLERLAGVIRTSGAELVALQEVDVGTGRAGGVDQAAELGRLTGMQSVFGEAMPYDGGSYGEAVLSAWPVVATDVVALAASSGHEPRAAVVVTVQPPWGGLPVRICGTHLDHTDDDTDRVAQAEALVAALSSTGTETLLVGDLNSEPGSRPLSVFEGAGWRPSDPTLTPTYPSSAPTLKIDWVLLAPEATSRVSAVEILDEPLASDHAPVLATWTFPPVPAKP